MPTPQLLLEHMRKHGQLLDREIANAIKIPLAEVREALAELSAQHEISTCSVTSFKDGKPVQAIQCRIFGYIPKPAPGRKPGSKPAE